MKLFKSYFLKEKKEQLTPLEIILNQTLVTGEFNTNKYLITINNDKNSNLTFTFTSKDSITLTGVLAGENINLLGYFEPDNMSPPIFTITEIENSKTISKCIVDIKKNTIEITCGENVITGVLTNVVKKIEMDLKILLACMWDNIRVLMNLPANSNIIGPISQRISLEKETIENEKIYKELNNIIQKSFKDDDEEIKAIIKFEQEYPWKFKNSKNNKHLFILKDDKIILTEKRWLLNFIDIQNDFDSNRYKNFQDMEIKFISLLIEKTENNFLLKYYLYKIKNLSLEEYSQYKYLMQQIASLEKNSINDQKINEIVNLTHGGNGYEGDLSSYYQSIFDEFIKEHGGDKTKLQQSLRRLFKDKIPEKKEKKIENLEVTEIDSDGENENDRNNKEKKEEFDSSFKNSFSQQNSFCYNLSNLQKTNANKYLQLTIETSCVLYDTLTKTSFSLGLILINLKQFEKNEFLAKNKLKEEPFSGENVEYDNLIKKQKEMTTQSWLEGQLKSIPERIYVISPKIELVETFLKTDDYSYSENDPFYTQIFLLKDSIVSMKENIENLALILGKYLGYKVESKKTQIHDDTKIFLMKKFLNTLELYKNVMENVIKYLNFYIENASKNTLKSKKKIN